jgi:hypothetical protein
MKFLDDMYGPDVLRTLKKIERKRHDVRRRLINEQVWFFFLYIYTFLDNTQIHIYVYICISLFN